MSYRITIHATFEDEDEANHAVADCEEAIGKRDGDLDYTEVENLDE